MNEGVRRLVSKDTQTGPQSNPFPSSQLFLQAHSYKDQDHKIGGNQIKNLLSL